jgi:hypothetical protein
MAEKVPVVYVWDIIIAVSLAYMSFIYLQSIT